MKHIYSVDDLVRVAKRENNTKRSYLYVDPLQGKHMPVSPKRSLELFSQLACMIETRYAGEAVLIIGFAETATAIGSAIACKAANCKYYLNTTREDIPGAEYLFFTESHSHATEQRLVRNGLDACMNAVDRIVFAEDEVTTGNTILKLIRLIQYTYPDRDLRFGIVSILNSMSDERLRELRDQGIRCDYIQRIPFEYRVDEINGREYKPLISNAPVHADIRAKEICIADHWNSRIVASVEKIRDRVQRFVRNALDLAEISETERDILILGTEEFMFPGMMIGSAIEAERPDTIVRFHATTRSPIEVCADSSYPLHDRSPLESVYAHGRKTFIYDLRRYDRVLIVTDAANIVSDGLNSILAALETHGNSNITLIRWGDRFDEE